MRPLASRTVSPKRVAQRQAAGAPQLTVPTRSVLVHAARGRPGWVVTCAALAAHHRYWREGSLKARLLTGDAELSPHGAPGAANSCTIGSPTIAEALQ
jgi:hypothetical protein